MRYTLGHILILLSPLAPLLAGLAAAFRIQCGNRAYLWLSPLVALTALFYIWAFRRKSALLERFASPALLRHILLGVSPGRQAAKAALLMLAAVFMILALIEPQMGYRWRELKRTGVDIMIALDTSKSMLASDVAPTRLSAAMRKIEDLMNILDGDRIGLVVFAGSSFLQCPLTLDYGALRTLLDSVNEETIPLPGTAVGKAIDKCLAAFDQKERKYKTIILITDGEDHEAKALDAAKAAREAGVPVYTVGVGTRAGAYIMLTDEQGNKVRLKARDGSAVKSHLDEKTLREIAVLTGGKFARADDQEWPLDRIYREKIEEMEERELAAKKLKRYEHRFQYPLAIALLLLLVEPFVGERRKL